MLHVLQQSERPLFRCSTWSLCRFSFTILAIFTLYSIFTPSSSPIHALSFAHILKGSLVAKETPIVRNALPSPDFYIPSNEYVDLKTNPNISHVTYDPFLRGVKRRAWPNERQPCLGPLGEAIDTDILQYYLPEYNDHGPLPLIGSYEEGGMDRSYCLESYERYKPYDYENDKRLDVDKMDWGRLQEECLEKNKANFSPHSTWFPPLRLRYPPLRDDPKAKPLFESSEKKGYRERIAIVIRTYAGQTFTPETIQTIRAVITETALYSGGLYTVYISMQMEDIFRPIFWDESEYQAALEEFVPAEFRPITVFWNEHIARIWVPQAMKDRTLEYKYHAPLLMLSIHAPQFDHFWQVELDVRYTGHWFDLFENADAWTRAQPRKLLWERAEQHYIPWYHGSWANFSDMVAAAHPDGGVWGPVKDEISNLTVNPMGPLPPTATAAEDDGTWGVGEAADLITLSKIFNTTKDGWYEWEVRGFAQGSPRRVLMLQAVVRISKRLLQASYDVNSQGFTWMTEGFYPTVALLHGLKVAHYPMPQFWGGMKAASKIGAEDDIKSLTDGLASAEHANDVINGYPDGVYNQAENPNHWAFHMPFWWTIDHGNNFYSQKLFGRWYSRENKERLCLPGMLFHPIKLVDGER